MNQSEIRNYNTDWLQVSALTRGTKSFDLIREDTFAEPIHNLISANKGTLISETEEESIQKWQKEWNE